MEVNANEGALWMRAALLACPLSRIVGSYFPKSLSLIS